MAPHLMVPAMLRSVTLVWCTGTFAGYAPNSKTRSQANVSVVPVPGDEELAPVLAA